MPGLSPAPACCSKPPKAGPTSRSAQPSTSAATPPFVCGSCTGRRIRGGAARQATTAISPGLDRWTGGPSDSHHVQSCPYWPRPLDRALVGWQGRRTGLRRVDLAGNHPPVAQKNELKPWQHEQWCIPAVRAEFVAPMEDVLDLYEEEYDPLYSTVCFDEKLVAARGERAASRADGARTGQSALITSMSGWARPICFSMPRRSRDGVMWK